MRPREEFVNQSWETLEEMAEQNDWLADTLLSEGSVRNSTPIPPEYRGAVNQIFDLIDPQPRKCWMNARKASRFDGCQYVEGYVFLEESSASFQHAWTELDEYVVELTWQERPDPPSDAIYIGVEYSPADIERAAKQDRYNCSVACGLEFLRIATQ